MAEKKNQRMTLKQYIHSNSLRKFVKSRASSRQSFKDGSTPCTPTLQNHQNASNKPSTLKESILQELKLKLTELISSDETLVQIFRLLDKAVSLFQQEIKQQTQQKQMIAAVLRENNISATAIRSRTNSGMKQSRVMIEHSSIIDNSKLEPSFHPFKSQRYADRKDSKDISQKQSIVNIDDCYQEENSKNEPSFHPLKSQRYFDKKGSHNPSEKQSQCENEDQDSIQIPSIKYLLTTRIKDKQTSEMPTKNTLDQNMLQTPNNQTLMDSFGIDQSQTHRRRKNSGKSNTSNLLDPAKFFNQQSEPSEIRFSIRSSIWNNNFEPISIRNTYNPGS